MYKKAIVLSSKLETKIFNYGTTWQQLGVLMQFFKIFGLIIILMSFAQAQTLVREFETVTEDNERNCFGNSRITVIFVRVDNVLQTVHVDSPARASFKLINQGWTPIEMMDGGVKRSGRKTITFQNNVLKMNESYGFFNAHLQRSEEFDFSRPQRLKNIRRAGGMVRVCDYREVL